MNGIIRIVNYFSMSSLKICWRVNMKSFSRISWDYMISDRWSLITDGKSKRIISDDIS